MPPAESRTEIPAVPNPPGVSKQLTAAEVGEILRIGPWAVVRLCQTGELRASKPGKSWLIDPADLQAYLDAHRNQPAGETA